MEILYLLIGFLFGALTAGLFFFLKTNRTKINSLKEADELKNHINSLNIEKGKSEGEKLSLEKNLSKISSELVEERKKVLELQSELSTVTANFNNLNEKLCEQKKEIEELQQKFTAEFKNIANEILEDKSKRFTEQNKINIEGILNPLNEKIKDFEKKVNEVYISDSKERAGLAQQLRQLHELNQLMAKEANNLTTALKGQTKTQGNWGEVILDSILEKSGLVKGREYFVQEIKYNEEGRRFQPDIIIKLPDNKSLIIDSKVSLLAYEKYCSCEEETDRNIALKEHIFSLRKHIKELSGKNYQSLYELNSLDFVLLFMPIEPAFGLAVQNEIGLFNEAFEKNIVIVSPSTLLATLRTIASIWRQENQNANALEIARQSGALYDKFQGLINDLIDLGKKMMGMQSSYEEAMKKLHSGRGNLVSSVEKIKKLGAKATKSLPQTLLDRTDDSDEDENEEENLFSNK